MTIQKLTTSSKWFSNGIPPAYAIAPWQTSNLVTTNMYPDESGTVEYRLNSLGYRDNEWLEIDFTDSVWCVGHSDVLGMGVNRIDTWQYKLPTNTINLGIAGGAWDTFSRIISSGLSKYKPKCIVIQATTKERKEYITHDTQRVLLPSLPQHLLPHKYVWKYDDDCTLDYMYEKNISLIKWACEANHVPLIMFELPNRWDLIKKDPANDKQHIGPNTHTMIAEYVTRELQSFGIL